MRPRMPPQLLLPLACRLALASSRRCGPQADLVVVVVVLLVPWFLAQHALLPATPDLKQLSSSLRSCDAWIPMLMML